MATLRDELQARVAEYDKWAIRRQYGADGPNNRGLWVLACMDERLPVDEALGIRADSPVGGGDAHLFRNAGGIVTDDAIRSAMSTINFFGTKEIIVLQHTGCGMLSANGSDLVAALEVKGIDQGRKKDRGGTDSKRSGATEGKRQRRCEARRDQSEGRSPETQETRHQPPGLSQGIG